MTSFHIVEIPAMASEPLVDWAETFRFLELLGRAPDSTEALLFPPKEGPGSDKSAKKLKLDEAGLQSVEQLLSMPLYRFHSLGIRPNPGGAKADDITEGRALFFEADGGLPLEAQAAFPELLGLPEPTVTVWTGGKSLHTYWVAEEGKGLPPDQWRKAQERLITAVAVVASDAGVDANIKDPSRVMRAPGGIHPTTGERARIHSESGVRYDLAALVEMLPKGLKVPALRLEHCANVPTEKVRELFIHNIAPQLKNGGIDVRSALCQLRTWREWHPEAFQDWDDLCWKYLQLDPQWVDQLEGTLEPRDPEKNQKKALEALSFLPPLDFTSYGKWLEVGMALHSVSEILLAAWVDWCRGMGDAFDEEECCTKWQTFSCERTSGITLGSLIHWAKEYGYRPPSAREDTPSRYTAAPSLPSAPSLPNGSPSRKELQVLSVQERMSILRDRAEELVEDEATPLLDRLPVMRDEASKLALPTRDSDLQKVLWEARRSLAAPAEAITTGSLLDFTPVPWCWEGLLIREATNLVVAAPKVGKTSLLLEAIASWHRGEDFLGRSFHGECPAVLIVGSDQPQSDWGRMLQRVGLVSEERKLLEPIVGLFHSGAPLSLDTEGIERIVSYARKHPGLLVVVDSYARCVSSLGLSERDAEIVGPLADLQEALGPYGATIVVIHHANKGGHESASMASRGSTALPAAVSQILHLTRLEQGQGGSMGGKRMLTSEGRGGAPEKMLLERSEEGRWLFRGDGDALLQEQERQKTIGTLNDRQSVALDFLEDVWHQTEGRQGISAELLASLMDLPGKDSMRAARRLLDQLEARGLARKVVQSEGKDRARVARYIPTSPSLEPSLADCNDVILLGADGKDGADGPAHERESVVVLAEPGNYVELINECEPPQKGWRLVVASGVVARIEHEDTGEIREVDNSEILSCAPF